MDEVQPSAVLVDGRMCVFEARAELIGDLQNDGERSEDTARGTAPLDRTKGQALHVLHRDEERARRLLELVGLNDVGVPQVATEAGFVDQRLGEHRVVAGALGSDLLQRDLFAEPHRSVQHGAKDACHAPRPRTPRTV